MWGGLNLLTASRKVRCNKVRTIPEAIKKVTAAVLLATHNPKYLAMK